MMKDHAEAASTDSPLAPLSREASEEIAKSVIDRMTADTGTVSVSSYTTAATRFARNEVLELEGDSILDIDMSVSFQGRTVSGAINQADAGALDEFVAGLEALARELPSASAQNYGQQRLPREELKFEDPPIFFDASVAAGAPAAQADIVQRTARMAEHAGLLGFGTVSIHANSRLAMNTDGKTGYSRDTYGEFSITARTKSGKGSGWAWGGREDFARVNTEAITEKAIDLAKRSDNPVAVEPGRYTVILEPEALAQLLDYPVLQDPTNYMNIFAANQGRTVFSKFVNKLSAGNKIGLQMADRRVQLYNDPYDAEMPYSPLQRNGQVLERGFWIENGVLTHLTGPPPMIGNPMVGNLAVSGQTQTLEQMIAGTKRGIWVHRFSSVDAMSPLTLLLTGVTRDGTFLIENGKVTKPVKNMRFSESPFFILNKIEAFGAPARASAALACPRLKVRDFEFTSLSDAI